MSQGTQSIETKISKGYQGVSKEISDFKYEKSEIPQELIDECEKLSIENGETYFIFDNSVSDIVKSRYINSKNEKREIALNTLLADEKYHIGTVLYFREMPSRFSYYDTETKQQDRYKKYQIVVDFLLKLGFESNREFNFGPEYDQSYLLKVEEKSYIARLKPNLFLSIQSGFTDDGQVNNIFDGFFSKNQIVESFRKHEPNFKNIIRDLKLEQIL